MHAPSLKSSFAGLLAFCGLALGLSAQPAPDASVALAPGSVKALDPKLPTIFIAGDSTAAAGGGAIQGWGVPFAAYFDPAKVNVYNGARGGRSSRTFITDGSWEQIISKVKAGDYVLLQLGINDIGAINDEPPPPLRARGTIPGIGEETKEIDNVLTKKHEVVHTYGWYMRKMISDTKEKGATPILLSLTIRNAWTDGKVERVFGGYSQWSREIAVAGGYGFIDLSNLVADHFEKVGADEMAKLYQPDKTHTNKDGADLNAATVVSGLKALRGYPFAQYLSPKGADVAPAPADRVVQASAASARARPRQPEPANPALPTVFLIGDSTVRNGAGDGQNLGAQGQWGWGEPIADYFDPAKANLVNRAVGGLSSRTYLTLGSWERVLPMIKPGDYVLMQFGHNDDYALNDELPGPLRARGTLKGIGEETKEIDNVMTKKHEVVHTYGWYLRKFIADTRAKGATPIVCSLIPRRIWTDDGKIRRNAADYAGWARQVAVAEKVGFIDLNAAIADHYDAIGHDEVLKLFPLPTPDEHTHTNRAGAEYNASVVIAGLKALPGDPLEGFFSAKAKAVAPLR
ncbi:MAG TPA: GDSL-type esterase/lipase family protein [Opitutaceae bacterium]|nr:GDSL-type esterase/lipase family protein [Opitutaceae bacterium]